MRRKRMAAAIISLAVVLSFVTSAFAVVDTYNNWRGFGIFEQGGQRRQSPGNPEYNKVLSR